jgi:hypothetical protein
VIFPSRGTSEFWRLYRALPTEVRMLAQKNYRLWSANAFHPSLHFKFSGKNFLWEWIGSHEDYNKQF